MQANEELEGDIIEGIAAVGEDYHIVDINIYIIIYDNQCKYFLLFPLIYIVLLI